MKLKILSSLVALLIALPCWGGVDLGGDADYVGIGPTIGMGLAFAVRRDEGLISAYIADGWRVEDRGNTITQGVFYHYVYISENGGNSTVYFDGNLISTVADDLGIDLTISMWASADSATTADRQRLVNRNNVNDIRIGYFSSVNNAWNGIITEYAMWSSVLTVEEVELLHSSKVKGMPLQIQPVNLVVYLPLDDHPKGTAINTTAFKDQSGNSYHGAGIDVDGDSSVVGETVFSYP